MSSVSNNSVLALWPSATPLDNLLPVLFYFSPSSRTATWLYTTVAIVVGLLILEQSIYRSRKAHLPGDNWTIPIIGKYADSVNPTMEKYQKQWNAGPLTAVSVFNIFIVMASSNQFTRKILNSPTYAVPCLVNSMTQILQPDNWVFLTGKAHVDYRRLLNTLFTHQALSIYIQIQDTICRKHIKKWLKTAEEDPSPHPIMFTMRELNMETSLKVFCGSHISDEAAQEINEKYWQITKALELVNFPLAIPGTKVYKAIQARKIAHKWIELAATRSRASMANGNEPECMLEEWIRELNQPNYKGRKDFTDREMALVIFAFLLASQDAMSSGVIYGFQHLADHPDVLAKVRQEQESVRLGNNEKPLTIEMLDQMPYLKAVVKESLRMKPPVTMVPYRAKKPFPISDDYMAPAGSIVIPSFYTSLHDPDVYPEPDTFKPERWLDPTSSANSNPQNFLVFGSGPHRCIGVEYANMNIALVLANSVALTNWEHHITPESDKVQIIASLFPKDGCLLKFTPRS